MYLFFRRDNKENAPSETMAVQGQKRKERYVTQQPSCTLIREKTDDTRGHKGYRSKLENGSHKL